MAKVLMAYIGSLPRYQRKCGIKFLFRKLMTSQTLGFTFDHPLNQWPTGKRGEKEI